MIRTRILLMGAAAAAGLALCAAQAQTADAQIALCKQGNGEASVAACSAVIQAGQLKGADLSRMYFGRGMGHDSLKQYAPAVEDYQQAFTVSRTNEEATYNRDVACNYLLLTLHAGTPVGATDGAAFQICGGAYNQARQYPRALEALDQAIRLKPDLARAYEDRGVAYLGTGNKDQALQEFDQAIKLAPPSDSDFLPGVLAVRAELRSDATQYALAIQDFDQAIKLKPENAVLLNARCWTRAIWGQELDTALADCNESLRLQPDDAATLDSRGFVQFRLGHYAEAIKDMDATIAQRSSYAGSLYVRGLAKIKSGDSDGGGKDVTRAKQLNGNVVKQYEGYGIKT